MHLALMPKGCAAAALPTLPACRLIQLQDVIATELQERGDSEELFRQLASTKQQVSTAHTHTHMHTHHTSDPKLIFLEITHQL